ncbi:putative protein OS=Streptomyces microflavus OX=1919 GN=Smic_45520 PE=4 SV=1 [Streptomyces microflavus]
MRRRRRHPDSWVTSAKEAITEWSFTSGTATTRTDQELPDIGFRVSGLGLRNETGPHLSGSSPPCTRRKAPPGSAAWSSSTAGRRRLLAPDGTSATAEGEVPVPQNTRYVSLRATGSDERPATPSARRCPAPFAGPAGVTLPPQTAGATAYP